MIILLSLECYFLLVLLNFRDVLLANRNVVLEVEVIVDSTEWQCLLLFENSEALEELTVVLVLAEQVERLEECCKQRLLCGAGTDDVCSQEANGWVDVI